MLVLGVVLAGRALLAVSCVGLRPSGRAEREEEEEGGRKEGLHGDGEGGKKTGGAGTREESLSLASAPAH